MPPALHTHLGVACEGLCSLVKCAGFTSFFCCSQSLIFRAHLFSRQPASLQGTPRQARHCQSTTTPLFPRRMEDVEDNRQKEELLATVQGLGTLPLDGSPFVKDDLCACTRLAGRRWSKSICQGCLGHALALSFCYFSI
jgi:hypothetical protein